MRLSKFSKVALVFACVALVLSAVLILVPTFSSEPNLPADAAISAASSFDKLSNGSKFYFTNPSANSSSTVTVSSSQPWGSQSNPFVINSTSQWLLFANKINSNDSNFLSKVFVLGNDLNFNNNSIPQVGCNSNGFKGSLFGNKHTVSNATIPYQTWVKNTECYAAGLFHYINGGSVYDLNIASNIKFTMKTNIVGKNIGLGYTDVMMGGLAAVGTSPLIVNVNSNVSINVAQTGTTNVGCTIGGIIGYSANTSVYKSSYNGTLYFKVSSTPVNKNGDGNHVGGIIGNDRGSGVTIIDQCAVSGTVSAENSGANVGGIMGYPKFMGQGSTLTITNCVINTAVKMLGTTNTNTSDCALITGEDMFQASTTDYNGQNCKLENIYILANAKVYRGSNDTTGGYYVMSAENGSGTATTPIFEACAKNIVLPISSDTAVYPTYLQSSTKNVKAGSASGVATQASKNANITNNFNVSASGVTSKLNAAGNINYDLGGGSWSPTGSKPATYNVSTSAISVPALSTKPTKTGFTFSKWSLDPSGTTTVTNIPANTTGNITFYAIWTLNNFSGTATNRTVVYESDATLNTQGITIPGSAGTGVGNVTVTYQWKNASGTAISGQTGSSYKLTKPGVTAGTNYQLTITSTPNDGRTAAKSQTYTIKLIVQRKGVAVPTAVSGLVYDGSSKTGVTLPSGAKYTLSGNTGTNAGSYTAKATLTDKNNYCWGSNNGTNTADQSISWSIAKATVAVPTVTTGTFTYSGSAQQPVLSYNTTLAKYTAVPQTDAGTYTAYVQLQNTTNYKWASVPTGVTESGNYPLTWKINKADVNVSAPAISNSNVYVGQLLSEISFANGGAATATNATTSTNTVTGTFAWKTDTEKVLAGSSSARTAVFTPSDTKNFNNKEVSVVFGNKLVQLYVNVYEAQVQFVVMGSNGTETTSFTLPAIGSNITRTQRVNRAVVQYPVDYKSDFTIANIGNDTAKNWQNPTGYSMHYYKAQNSDLSGSVEYDTPNITNITANQRVYIDYVPANDGQYTVFHIYETTSHGVATLDGIANALQAAKPDEALAAIGVTRQIVKNATIGSKVNGTDAKTAGFTFARTLTDGTGGEHTSDYQSKFVRGDGETVLYMYYSRNGYTVTWDLRGGSVVIDGSTKTGTVKQVNVLFGDTVNTIPDPTRDQYTFDNWYADSDYNEVATIAKTMPARNLTYYAFWRGDEYYLRYDNIGNGIDDRYKALIGEEAAGGLAQIVVADNPAMFSTDGLLKSTIMLKNPSLTGYTFIGWYIEGTDTKVTSIAYGQTYITQNKGTLTLVARWSPQTYTITLDPNGGRKPNPSTIRVTNMTNYTSSTSLKNGTLPTPTFAGYNFVEWYYVNKLNGQEIAVDSSTTFNYLTNNLTLLARWEKKAWNATYTEMLNNGTTTEEPDYYLSDVAYTVNGKATDENDQPWVTDTLAGNLVVGDVLTVNVTPYPGYEVAEIRIAGTRVNNGARYTVKSSYANDTLNIVVTFRYKSYRISYVWDGGVYGLASGTLAQSFTLNDEKIVFPNETNVSRLGYEFSNWYLGASEADGGKALELDANNEIIVYDIQDWFENYLGMDVSDITLYAYWEAAEVAVILHQNVVNEQTTVFMEGQTRTGDVIQIEKVDDTLIPANRELAGWALSADGSIVYPVEYNANYEVLPLNYTVEAKLVNGKLENHLYAVWRLTNVQFLVFSVPNNNAEYDPSSSWEGIKMTARPRYTYVADPTISIDFLWYKADPAWDKWTEADLPADMDSALYAEIYAKLGTYKIPADATPVRRQTISSVLDDNQFDTFTVKNVADSGIYVCVMEAHGERLTSNNTQATSVATGVGQYDVTVRKATFKGLQLDSELDFKYDATIRTLSIKTSSGATVNENSNIVLPDGSVLAVIYTYFTTGSDEESNIGAMLAGSYTVRAQFSWIKDNGNYNLPEELAAQLDIAEVVINQVSYSLEKQNDDGTWSEVQSSPKIIDGNLVFDEVPYAAAAYRVVAKSNDILEADRKANNPNVTIAIFTEGDLSNPNGGADLAYATYVGEYRAYCDELAGSRASCYLLNNSSLQAVAYSIVKAKHDLDITFNDKTVVYDRNNPTTAQEIDITSILDNSDGTSVNVPMTKNADGTVTIQLSADREVTISYTSTYTAYNSAFTASKTNNGGVNAGVYVVTASFKDSEVNEQNFEAIESITATLTIKQATYVLSDDELNKDATDTNVNDIIIGFVNNQSFEYKTNTAIKYFAQMNLDNNFRVEYEGTRTFESQGSSETTALDNAAIVAGVRLPGKYLITAKIYLESESYKNNYLGISAQTVELQISRGKVVKVEASYDQKTDLYTYFDTFDFVDNADRGNLHVYVTYENDSGTQETETVDISICNFYGEDGSLFERFDRASANTVGSLSGDYTIVAECYGMKSVLDKSIKVNVEQAEFNADAVAFESDNNLSYVRQDGGADVYSLNFTYDGTYHNPVVANADKAYNFVGVDDETGVNHGITTKYMLQKGSDPAAEMDKDGAGKYVGVRDNGNYTITVTFEHTDGNYKTISKTFKVQASIARRQLTADDIIWQYKEAGVWTTITGENRKYIGVDYEVRAVFRNLAVPVDNKNDPAYYITVGQIKVNDKSINGTSVAITATDPAASVLLKDAAMYTIQINSLGTEGVNDNYSVPSGSGMITVKFTIDPKEVTLDWAIDGNDLIYNANNQIDKISVSYTGVDGINGADKVVNIQNDSTKRDIAVTEARFTASDSVAVDVIKHAGTYILTATITDTNYVASVATYTVTVAPKTIETAKFTYQGKDGEVEMIADDTTTDVYKGAEFEITVEFDGIENDPFVTTFKAVSRDGQTIRNANEYIIDAGIDASGNYKITAYRSFVIEKYAVEIDWRKDSNKFTYNAQEQTVIIIANGVGDEASIQVVALEGDKEINANVDDDFYLAKAKIADAYADNYKIADSSDKEMRWRIEPKPVSITWSVDPMTYTGYVIPFTATATDESGNALTLETKITIKNAPDETLIGGVVAEMVNAYTYTVEVVGITGNTNYTVVNGTAVSHDYEVKKATPNVTDVSYNEFGLVNKAYRNEKNPLTLRADKILYNSNGIKGTIAFVQEYTITTIGNGIAKCVFTPEDTVNYNVVTGIEIVIEKINDTAVKIGLETAIKYFMVNSDVSKSSFQFYKEYASFYKEKDADGVERTYGYRERITDTSNISFVINGFNGTYKIKDTDVDTGIDITVDYDNLSGSKWFAVTKSAPRSISIADLDSYTGAKYYIGSNFDYSKMQFNVVFEDGGDGVLNADQVEVSKTLMDKLGAFSITFTYGTVSVTLDITVSDKEQVVLSFNDKTYKYTGSAITPIVQQIDENGNIVPLPDDVTVEFKNPDGTDIGAIINEGDYVVMVVAKGPEYKYKEIASAQATIKVRAFDLAIDEDEVLYPSTIIGGTISYQYNGKEQPFELKNIVIKDSDGKVYEYAEGAITYVVKRNGAVVTSLVEAGTYNVHVEVKVYNSSTEEDATVEHDYTIIINQVNNEIYSLTMGSWIKGDEVKSPSISALFGADKVIYEYFTADGVSLGKAKPTDVGNYYVTATIPATESYKAHDPIRAYFSINNETYSPDKDKDGNSLKDENGADKIIISTENGVDPSYRLVVDTLENDKLGEIQIKNKIVLGGYNLELVDQDGNRVDTTDQSYTVKLLIAPDQRNGKKYAVYAIDENGVKVLVDSARREGDYMVFTTSDFAQDYVITCRDEEAMKKIALIIGVSVGAVIAVGAISALIAIFVKKKKENDD